MTTEVPNTLPYLRLVRQIFQGTSSLKFATDFAIISRFAFRCKVHDRPLNFTDHVHSIADVKIKTNQGNPGRCCASSIPRYDLNRLYAIGITETTRQRRLRANSTFPSPLHSLRGLLSLLLSRTYGVALIHRKSGTGSQEPSLNCSLLHQMPTLNTSRNLCSRS